MAAAGYAPAAMAAGAAIPGLNALLLPLLASFGPALFSKLFNRGQDPSQQIRELLKPENIAKLQGQFYQQGLQSPAFAKAQSSIATGANQASNQIGASLAARGLGTTGTGAVLSGLTPSLVGSQKADLYAGVGEAANRMTMQNIQDRISALQNQKPSQSAQFLGGGLEAFGPFLQAYLKGKFPGSYATG